jgi:hypothetical protein
MSLKEVQDSGRQTGESQREQEEHPADGEVDRDLSLAPHELGLFDVGEDEVEGDRGAEGGERDDDLEEGFEPRGHGDAGVLGDGFDVWEAGVVLVRGDGVAGASCGSWWVGVDGLVWGGFIVDGIGMGHCVIEVLGNGMREEERRGRESEERRRRGTEDDGERERRRKEVNGVAGCRFALTGLTSCCLCNQWKVWYRAASILYSAAARVTWSVIRFPDVGLLCVYSSQDEVGHVVASIRHPLQSLL